MWDAKIELFENIDDKPVLFHRIKEITSYIENSDKILTSHDFPNCRVDLSIKDLPDGFQQVQLPFKLKNSSAMFFTTAAPNAFFPEHIHSKANVFRIVVAGSISVEGCELIAGDWMFVPAGSPYWIKAGDIGATIVHNYEQEPPS